MGKEGRKGRPRRTGDGSPHPVDLHVGSRVQLRRSNLGLSRSKLARDVNLTFQQIQKFERGTNRISASRLADLARALDVPVSFFFDDMPESLAGAAAPDGQRTAPRAAVDPMTQRETVELVRAYHRIPDRELRKSIYDVARALAANRRFGAARRDAPPTASEAEENNGDKRGS